MNTLTTTSGEETVLHPHIVRWVFPTVLVLGLVGPILGTLLLGGMLAGLSIPSLPFHSALEVAGAALGLVLAVLIVARFTVNVERAGLMNYNGLFDGGDDLPASPEHYNNVFEELADQEEDEAEYLRQRQQDNYAQFMYLLLAEAVRLGFMGASWRKGCNSGREAAARFVLPNAIQGAIYLWQKFNSRTDSQLRKCSGCRKPRNRKAKHLGLSAREIVEWRNWIGVAKEGANMKAEMRKNLENLEKLLCSGLFPAPVEDEYDYLAQFFHWRDDKDPPFPPDFDIATRRSLAASAAGASDYRLKVAQECDRYVNILIV